MSARLRQAQPERLLGGAPASTGSARTGWGGAQASTSSARTVGVTPQLRQAQPQRLGNKRHPETLRLTNEHNTELRNQIVEKTRSYKNSSYKRLPEKRQSPKTLNPPPAPAPGAHSPQSPAPSTPPA